MSETTWDADGIPTMRARWSNNIPCRLCDKPMALDELITKRWGVWIHADCYRGMTSAQRWDLTQRINAQRGR